MTLYSAMCVAFAIFAALSVRILVRRAIDSWPQLLCWIGSGVVAGSAALRVVLP